MVNSQNKDPLFYQNLGKLFYAIAAADKIIETAEIEKLKTLIHDTWLDFEGTSFKNHTSTIFSTFNWLVIDGEYDAETCFKEFISFKNTNESLFNQQIKLLIMQTADAIASSFSQKNKSELIMLAKLYIELKK